jgi:hypothetical protein
MEQVKLGMAPSQEEILDALASDPLMPDSSLSLSEQLEEEMAKVRASLGWVEGVDDKQLRSFKLHEDRISQPPIPDQPQKDAIACDESTTTLSPHEAERETTHVTFLPATPSRRELRKGSVAHQRQHPPQKQEEQKDSTPTTTTATTPGGVCFYHQAVDDTHNNIIKEGWLTKEGECGVVLRLLTKTEIRI